jgi:hypothetical protein
MPPGEPGETLLREALNLFNSQYIFRCTRSRGKGGKRGPDERFFQEGKTIFMG